MRPSLLALSALLLLASCGDDGKVAPKTPPGSPPKSKREPPMGSWDVQPPVVQERSSKTSWARTRPGDKATWEIRVADIPLVTRLTWTAVAIEDGNVHYDVSSTTTDAAGLVQSTASSRGERQAVGLESPLPAGLEKPFEAGEVDGKTIRQVVQAAPDVDGVIVAISDQVPFGGMVRYRMGGVDQRLVAFEKAP